MGIFDKAVTQESTDTLEEKVAEAEARLQEVGYYRSLMQSSLFDAGDPIGERVQEKLRTFAQKEIATIVGMPQSPIDGMDENEAAVLQTLSKFSEEEVNALKTLAQLGETEIRALQAFIGRVLENPSLVGSFLKPMVAKPEIKPRPTVKTLKPVVKAPAVIKVEPVAKAKPTSPIVLPPEEEPGKPKTRLANLKSPHSKPHPFGDELTRVTQERASTAVQGSNRQLAADAKDPLGKIQVAPQA